MECETPRGAIIFLDLSIINHGVTMAHCHGNWLGQEGHEFDYQTCLHLQATFDLGLPQKIVKRCLTEKKQLHD